MWTTTQNGPGQNGANQLQIAEADAVKAADNQAFYFRQFLTSCPKYSAEKIKYRITQSRITLINKELHANSRFK